MDKIGTLVKLSLCDFPSKIAATVFLAGCNMRCPYCYNTDLVKCKNTDYFVTLQEVIDYLQKRKDVLQALVISGGEALLHPECKNIIQIAHRLGYRVKLDTNGTLPHLLKALCSSPLLCPDYVAMDIKTSPSKYKELFGSNEDNAIYIEESLKESINIIKNSIGVKNSVFRTVLVPPLVQKEDIANIATLLPEGANWHLSPFRNGNCLNPNYSKIPPYTTQQITELFNYAKSLCPNVKF